MYSFQSMKHKIIFIVYNLLIVLIVLLVSEFIINYCLNHPDAIPNFSRNSFRKIYQYHDRNIIQVVPECARYDSGLFYTLTPGKCLFANREFQTIIEVNNLGVRDDERSLDFPSVIISGDSFSMGWGVQQDSTFANILEDHLNISVLNASISSYSTVRELKLLERVKIDSLKTLIIQYHPNDSIENYEYFKNRNELIISTNEMYLNTLNEIEKRNKYYFGKYSSLLLKYYIKSFINSENKSVSTDNNEAKYFINALLNSRISLNGVQIIVFELNDENLNDNKFIIELDKLIRDNTYPDYIENLITIEVSQFLKDSDYFILDDHINNSGHKKIGNLLLDYIR